MTIYQATSTFDGLNDDLSLTPAPAEAETLLVGTKKIDLDAHPKLKKGIFKTGVGTDNLPFEAAKERGFTIDNCTRGGHLEAFPRKPLEEVLGALPQPA